MSQVTLESCVVRRQDLAGIPQGTGFVVGPTLAVTCVYVLEMCDAGPVDRIQMKLRPNVAEALEERGWA